MVHAVFSDALRKVVPHLVVIIAMMVMPWGVCAADVTAKLSQTYKATIRPLLARYCYECHDKEVAEADIDLSVFGSVAEVRKKTAVWMKVRKMLEGGQMPPKDSQKPTDKELTQLRKWVHDFLAHEARARAGDPGLVLLRRLSNVEYTHTIRDLTGIDSLDPVHEFPVDGAAGEGFTNTGAALVMSPMLLTKYLDAAKNVSRHAVLLPRGIAFSKKRTRRDWTDEKLAAIREFYARYCVSGGNAAHNLQGVKFTTRDGGVIPLERYLRVTLSERNSLTSGQKDIATAARQHRLSPKYLATLWEALNGTERSLLLDRIRGQWRAANPNDAGSIAKTIKAWQRVLWYFTTVGHIGRRDGPKAWQLPVMPLVSRQQVRLKLPKSSHGNVVRLFLTAGDAGDGHEQDVVVWKDARLVIPDQPSIPLANLELVVASAVALQKRELPRSGDYLDAVAESHATKQPIEKVAVKHGLNPTLAANWAAFVALDNSNLPKPSGHFADKLSNLGGHLLLRGWGSLQTPMLLANQSKESLRFGTLTMPARGVAVHPSSDKDSILFWKSPIEGSIRIQGLVADADRSCGNGVSWRIDGITSHGIRKLANGMLKNGGRQEFSPSATLAVRKGDLVKLTVNARDGNHACDTTHVTLTLTETSGKRRIWNLAHDVVDRIHESNPLPDLYGNPDVWHFCASGMPSKGPTIPHGSALAAWRDAVLAGKPVAEVKQAAEEVQSWIVQVSKKGSKPDEALKTLLRGWQGPLHWLSPSGHRTDIEQSAPSTLEFRIPTVIAMGAEFVATAVLHPDKGKAGSVQVRASLTKPPSPMTLTPGSLKAVSKGKRTWTTRAVTVLSNLPIIVHENSEAQKRIARDLKAFQQIFPVALCYTKIVPDDESVTMILFHREDDHLRRLMLDPDEVAELDRLWKEFHFVSQDALQQAEVFEQVWQFATQDADPTVFEPLREPIRQAAARFHKQLIAAEPSHLDAVLRIAVRAWRHPLSGVEEKELRDVYAQLRTKELPHDVAIRLTLARMFLAPEFLYKLEKPKPGTTPAPVSDFELATRLSYFLWSSLPDEKLRHVAQTGNLNNDSALVTQTQRMLKDPRTRRLAIQFACQWLHVRDFDKDDGKNEKLYPEFAALRNDMYEETVRFFEDMFRNNGSILGILDADHTFLNPAMAKHYGIKGVNGTHWRRVAGMQSRGRGGVLGMATVLASQSGASRTSPILRGNWVYETLLGERLPRPPANVPQLPEELPQGLNARQLIEHHSSNPACAKCHKRIDPYGFALEQYDAIGRLRPKKVDTTTKLLNGKRIEGIDGLRDYLAKDRRDDVLRQFCRKLLGYALGREIQLSDEPLLSEMQAKLVTNKFRFHVAVRAIVTSPQFRTIRGREMTGD